MAELSRTELARELEWRKIVRDPVYFLDTYWNIEVIGKGYEVAGLRDYQRSEIETYQAATEGEAPERQVRLKARQIGYTTIADGFAFHSAFFHSNHPWLLAQQSEDDAKETLQKKIRVPYLMLPSWIRDRGPRLVTDNTEMMRFDNGSEISVTHSGASAARSRAVYGTIMDEAAFMEDAESLFGALDPMTYGPLLLFSTANGMGNFFHDIWLDAQLPDSVWGSGFYPWSVVPNRTEEWYASQRRKYRGRDWLFYQEYPASPAEAFAKSGRTALPVELMEETQPFSMPDYRHDVALLDIYDTTATPVETQLERSLIEGEIDERDLELWIWEYPYTERDDWGVIIRKPNFVVSVDVSEGLEDGDYTAITVMDANHDEEVASFRGHIPYEDIGPLAEWLGYWYYTALVLVERNNQGLVPLEYLRLNAYPRLYRMDSIAQQKRGDRTPRYGWHTNRSTKPKMVIELTEALRDEAIILRDPRLLDEARTFLSDGKGGYGASSGNHDDKVMSVAMGHQGCRDVGEYPIVWVDHEARPLTFDDFFGHLQPQTQQTSPLYRPIGQPERGTEQVREAWMIHEANLAKRH